MDVGFYLAFFVEVSNRKASVSVRSGGIIYFPNFVSLSLMTGDIIIHILVEKKNLCEKCVSNVCRNPWKRFMGDNDNKFSENIREARLAWMDSVWMKS